MTQNTEWKIPEKTQLEKKKEAEEREEGGSAVLTESQHPSKKLGHKMTWLGEAEWWRMGSREE